MILKLSSKLQNSIIYKLESEYGNFLHVSDKKISGSKKISAKDENFIHALFKIFCTRIISMNKKDLKVTGLRF